MHHRYDHLIGMPDIERALFRAGHIYILFSSLIHLVLGSYLNISTKPLKRMTQGMGSLLLVAATILIIFSFFYELPTNQIERGYSRYGIYLTLAGVLLHAIPEKKLSLFNRD